MTRHLQLVMMQKALDANKLLSNSIIYVGAYGYYAKCEGKDNYGIRDDCTVDQLVEVGELLDRPQFTKLGKNVCMDIIDQELWFEKETVFIVKAVNMLPDKTTLVDEQGKFWSAEKCYLKL